MKKHCENCGTKFSNGFCPNCEEAAFIAETQSEFMRPEKEWSPEFKAEVDKGMKAKAQRDLRDGP